MTMVFTIGYEGSEVEPFVDTLRAAGVKHVIDIRDVPASRKRGFSKSALSARLDDAGISYSHLKPLGDPKPGREAMRTGDYKLFLSIYNEHVERPEAQACLHEAVSIAAQEPSVLLCYERDPKHCHRTLVADMMKAIASFSVRHLGVAKGGNSTRTRGANGAKTERALALG